MRDADFNFGSERFDLVLFSWAMPPANLMTRIADSLRPGGLVVLECGAHWLARDAFLKLFGNLPIERYEIVNTRSDFFNRSEMEVLRLVARKQP